MKRTPKYLIARLRQLYEFGTVAEDIWSVPALVLLGFARGLDGDDRWSRVSRRMLPLLRIRPKRFHGRDLKLNPADFSHVLVAEEFFIQKLYDLNRVSFRPTLILDCGAHIGFFATLAGATFDESPIVAFEPDSRNIKLLRDQSIALEPRLKIIEAAVSTFDGKRRFASSTSLSGHLVEMEDSNPLLPEVEVVDLRRFIPEDKSQKLLLKLDVEGEEQAIVPHIVDSLPDQCAVFVEVHRGRRSWDELSNLLHARGFAVSIDRDRDQYIDGFAVRLRRQ